MAPASGSCSVGLLFNIFRRSTVLLASFSVYKKFTKTPRVASLQTASIHTRYWEPNYSQGISWYHVKANTPRPQSFETSWHLYKRKELLKIQTASPCHQYQAISESRNGKVILSYSAPRCCNHFKISKQLIPLLRKRYIPVDEVELPSDFR